MKAIAICMIIVLASVGAHRTIKRPSSTKCKSAHKKCLTIEDVPPNETPTADELLDSSLPCAVCEGYCLEGAKKRGCITRLADYVLTTCSRYRYQCGTKAGTRQVCDTCWFVCAAMSKPIDLLDTRRREEMIPAAKECKERFL